MKDFIYAGNFEIYDNPYFITLFFAVILIFFIFVLIKTDNNAARREKNTNTTNSMQQYSARNFEEPSKPINLNKIEKLEKVLNTEKNEALEILKIRYAKGEINEEEFERIKRAII